MSQKQQNQTDKPALYSQNKGVNKYSPLNSWDLFHNEFDSFFDRALDFAWSSPGWVTNRNWRHTDITEDDKSYTIEVELPRFKKEELSLKIVNNTIQLTAQNDRSSYVKSWALSNVNLDKLTSKLENGVLSISVEKTPESQPKVIEIQ